MNWAGPEFISKDYRGCCRISPQGRHPEDSALKAGIVTPLSPAPIDSWSDKPRIQMSRVWANEVTLHKTSDWGLFEAIVRREFSSFALLPPVWRNTVWSFYLSLRPHAWDTAKGRFPDQSDQSFYRAL